ncbi:MAG: hypothetical protein EZS28_030562 [Streblomastix strix]|uniref:Uncharacterized protein n=1 Tax=Streblomastix strix TaxID=222440 RepID=A0A5J4UUP6_9EUKA|nr:MAG: hypothetical protein EZS28_030562 [Streblomastix strix]
MAESNNDSNNFAVESLQKLIIVPSEYNVINGLIGLGEYVLLEILSEIKLVPNAVEFIGVNKKTFQLIKHARFYKIIETLNYPISIINSGPNQFELVDIDVDQIKIVMKLNGTILLSQVLENGIWSVEIIFQSYQRFGLDCENIAAYCGGNWEGVIQYKCKVYSGNVRFQKNEIIRLEFDSEKGTLFFFVDNIQQPVYISGIKEKVRFVIFMNSGGESSCIIHSLKKLIVPTSGHLLNEKAVEW